MAKRTQKAKPVVTGGEYDFLNAYRGRFTIGYTTGGLRNRVIMCGNKIVCSAGHPQREKFVREFATQENK